MKKALSLILATLMFFGGLFISASALDIDTTVDNTPRPRTAPATMTKSARVLDGNLPGLGGSGETLTVYFDSFTFARKGDHAQQLQSIPQSGAAFLLSNGNPMRQSLAYGQEVDITFTYQMIDSGATRELVVISVQKVQMKGRALRLGNAWDMRPNTVIGTIISANRNRIVAYIEGGLVYFGDNEFIAKGRSPFTINSGTRILDKAGKQIQSRDLKPFQRVEIRVSDHSWMESSPPQYGGGTASTIRLLEYGDKWVAGPSWGGESEPPSSAHRWGGFVVEQQVSASELLVQPLWAEQRYNTPKAIVRLQNETSARYTPGQILSVWYLAVNNKANPPVYSYATITGVDQTRRWTAQELSGVFGKPSDVTLTVPGTLAANAATISATWTNKTSTQLMYGQSFKLERKTQSKWVLYNEPDRKGNYGFTSEGIVVDPRSQAEMAYGVRVYSDKLPSGTYRIVTDFMPVAASGDVIPGGYIIYSNEFTVK